MNVLYLGVECDPIQSVISSDDSITSTDEPLTRAPEDFDLMVSYRYRHIIPEKFLVIPAFNLHFGYLPYNRGADPVLWSVIDETPAGVTIHEIDAGLDTGPIVAQLAVWDRSGDTLRTLYRRHELAAVRLFAGWWPRIRNGNYITRPNIGGTYHSLSERPELPQGWDTPVSYFLPTNFGGGMI